MSMNQRDVFSFAKKITPGAALGIGIAAGFAFLAGLGSALRVLPGDLAPLFCLGIALFASLNLLLRK